MSAALCPTRIAQVGEYQAQLEANLAAIDEAFQPGARCSPPPRGGFHFLAWAAARAGLATIYDVRSVREDG